MPLHWSPSSVPIEGHIPVKDTEPDAKEVDEGHQRPATDHRSGAYSFIAVYLEYGTEFCSFWNGFIHGVGLPQFYVQWKWT